MIGSVALPRQTWERTWRVTISIAARPRWTASWRLAMLAEVEFAVSSSRNAANSTMSPTLIATSSSVSE